MFDEIFLDLTALVSFVMAVALLWTYPRRKQIHGLLWAIAAIVFFVTTLLLAMRGLTVLGEPYVPVLAAFIPALFADGVLFAFFKDRRYGISYLAKDECYYCKVQSVQVDHDCDRILPSLDRVSWPSSL